MSCDARRSQCGERQDVSEDKSVVPAKRDLNVPSPVVGLIALLFTGAMIWNIVIQGDSMVTIALASAVPFLVGVPVGLQFFNKGGGGSS
jgi:hypothetical protein